MGAVTGQKGILVSLEYYYNSSPTGSAGHPFINDNNDPADPDYEVYNGGCSTPGTEGSLGDMDCRFGLQLTNRETEWLVAKNGYASLVITKLSLDASYLADSRGSDDAYKGWFNTEKFEDADGCLLETCSASAIEALAGLRTHYADSGGSYNPTDKTVSGYNDVRFGMFFEGLAVEANTDITSTLPGVQDGWKENRNGSFLGLNIADNNGYQAGIAFGGDFYLYGY